jgi:hypothetical protein
MINKIKQFIEDNWMLLTGIWIVLAFILSSILLSSCENSYKPNKNYKYTFSGAAHKDNLGRKVYGSHHFILDEPIQDMASFKECYVKYLEWSGLDKDGLYKKAYYQDDKNIIIKLFDETWGNVTIQNADLCN